MNHLQLDQLAMLSRQEAQARARQARLAASVRGARRASWAAASLVSTVVTSARRSGPVPLTR